MGYPERITDEQAPAKDNKYYTSLNPMYPDFGMPNCVCYAWGRFYEMSDKRPRLSTSNAQDWYGYTSDGYERSKTTPKVGAVLCWSDSRTTDGGHVAIVEKINSDGTLITSNSEYNGRYFTIQTISPPKAGNTSSQYPGPTFTFQGYIYNPDVSGGPIPSEYSPTIDSIKQTNATTIIIKGTLGGTSDNMTNVRLYYKWDSETVANNDASGNILGDGSATKRDFTIDFDIPDDQRDTKKIAFIVYGEKGGKLTTYCSDITIFQMKPSYPIINVKIGDKWQQCKPYILYQGAWKPCVPYLKQGSSWVAIYNYKK